MTSISPGLVLILGAIAVPLLRGTVRQTYMLVLPLVALTMSAFLLETGVHEQLEIMGVQLTLVRVDKLSTIFGIIFSIAAALGVLYGQHEQDDWQQTAGLVYAGAALGAVYAGDLLTLFIFWELTAVSSVFLIWASRTERAYKAGMRYLIIQVGSGVLLMAGAIYRYTETGSLEFSELGLDGFGNTLIFLAFGIKCAFPLLHNWLEDAYPEATVSGTVMLSAFTTKLAVYSLARGFPGTEVLIYIGVTMAAFPIFYAVIENDLRRVLAYSLNHQLGFMVTGIGVGTPLAINGTVAHAFCSVLYKALLFMSMGAVLHRTGTIKGSDLGGLYKSMPWTTVFCLIGAASISAFPLFSGFVSKSMILTAVAEQGYIFPWLLLLFASAGAFHHSGIKVPFFAFFGHDSQIRVKEAPLNMLLAMGFTSIFCIGIGIFPWTLYTLLPYSVDYYPYTTYHIINQLQLLLFSALAFAWLMRTGVYPPGIRSTNLDFDIVYRHGIPSLVRSVTNTISAIAPVIHINFIRAIRKIYDRFQGHYGEQGFFVRPIGAGNMVFWVLTMLVGYLLISVIGY